MQETELDEPDRLFRWWCHMMVMLHAETYYHSFHVGMMPETHWQGYVKYVAGYLQSPGIRDFWNEVGPAFSADFSSWIDEQLEQLKE